MGLFVGLALALLGAALVLLAPSLEPRALAALAAAGAGLGAAATVAFLRHRLRTLRQLRRGVERMAEGDLEARVVPHAKDELADLARAFNQMGESLSQTRRLHQAFGRYASDYVLERLLHEAHPQLEGAEREITILFADVRAFTRLSEGLPARQVVALLNEVFQLASDCILARGGSIDKFMGDAVMACFGAPLPVEDHALRAVEAAQDLVAALAKRNASLAPGGVAVEMGLGIHTGRVVVGNIGSERRTDFTSVGDPVNVAQRLEKLAGGGEILVSEAVQRRVRHAVPLRFAGAKQLVGRRGAVHVYQVGDDPSAREGAHGSPACGREGAR
jgi:adenylate cyclase